MITPTALRQRDPLRHRSASRRVQFGDRDHVRCTSFLRENWPRLAAPSLAVTEVCHLPTDPQRRGHSELAPEFCGAVAADELRVIAATPHDYRRMAELLTTYASLRH